MARGASGRGGGLSAWAGALGEGGRHTLGPWVCGRFPSGVGFTPHHLRSRASWGLPPEPAPRDPQCGGSRGRVARGAGCGAPSVRLGDRCRLLFRFRASGRSAPAVVPTSALRGQSCQLLSPVPKSGHAEEPLSQTPLLPGETQLRANPEDDTRAETRGAPGLRAAPGREKAAAGRTGCARGAPGARTRRLRGAGSRLPRGRGGGALGRLPRPVPAGPGRGGGECPGPAPAPPRSGAAWDAGRRRKAPRDLPAAPRSCTPRAG